MLVAKLKGKLYHRAAHARLDRVPPTPVADLRKATIALVTSGGSCPRAIRRINPPAPPNMAKYSLEGFTDLTPETHQTAHGGYDPVYANQDPDRVLPLDVMRDLVAEGVIGGLHPYYYATVGKRDLRGQCSQFWGCHSSRSEGSGSNCCDPYLHVRYLHSLRCSDG